MLPVPGAEFVVFNKVVGADAHIDVGPSVGRSLHRCGVDYTVRHSHVVGVLVFVALHEHTHLCFCRRPGSTWIGFFTEQVANQIVFFVGVFGEALVDVHGQWAVAVFVKEQSKRLAPRCAHLESVVAAGFCLGVFVCLVGHLVVARSAGVVAVLGAWISLAQLVAVGVWAANGVSVLVNDVVVECFGSRRVNLLDVVVLEVQCPVAVVSVSVVAVLGTVARGIELQVLALLAAIDAGAYEIVCLVAGAAATAALRHGFYGPIALAVSALVFIIEVDAEAVVGARNELEAIVGRAVSRVSPNFSVVSGDSAVAGVGD